MSSAIPRLSPSDERVFIEWFWETEDAIEKGLPRPPCPLPSTRASKILYFNMLLKHGRGELQRPLPRAQVVDVAEAEVIYLPAPTPPASDMRQQDQGAKE